MPWPTYTERFIVTDEFGAWQHYAIPTNHRGVVRSISGLAPPNVGAKIIVAIHGIQVWSHSFRADETGVSIDCMLVVYEQEWVQVLLTTTGQTVTLAGHLFEDRSPDPHPPADAAVLPMPPSPAGPNLLG